MTTTTAITTKPKSATLRDQLQQLKPRLADILPKHLSVEGYLREAMFAAMRDPKIANCSPATVVQSVMTAAQLGLDCTGILGSGYLVPFKNNKTGQYDCQFIPGYRGLIDLARRSGQIITIEAHPVFEGEAFHVELGIHSDLSHTPTFEHEDPSKLKFVYAVAKLRDGGIQFEVMSKTQVDGVRARSRAGQYGPWSSDYIPMALKTVIRRLVKYLPMSVELERAIDLENRIESGEDVAVDLPALEEQPVDGEVEDVPAASPKSAVEELKAKIAKDKAQESE